MSMTSTFILAAAVLSFAATSAFAQSRHAEVSLVTDADAFVAGEPMWVGVRFELDPHWHVYWQNPGDSGTPPKVTWELPAGFTAGELQYPVPQRFEYGGIEGFGYEGDVTYLVQITPPAELPDEPVTLSAKVDYLICDPAICVPESAEVSTEVGGEGKQTDRLADAQAKLPEPTPEGIKLSEPSTAPLPAGEVLFIEVPWEGVVPEDVAFYPLPEANLVVEGTAIKLSPPTSVVSVNAHGRALGDLTLDHLDGLLVWTDAEGNRRGMILPIPYDRVLR